jgi:predicted Zn-dependent protease with MMP-like domain
MPHTGRVLQLAGGTAPAADSHGNAAVDNGLVIEVGPGRFEEIVAALDGLPQELGQLMRNGAVTAERQPGPPGLLGLYQGNPLTSRTSQYTGVLPDRITIYRQAICATAAASRNEAVPGVTARRDLHAHRPRQPPLPPGSRPAPDTDYRRLIDDASDGRYPPGAASLILARVARAQALSGAEARAFALWRRRSRPPARCACTAIYATSSEPSRPRHK